MAASDGAEMDAVSPIDGRVFTKIAAGQGRGVDAAVAAARASFDGGNWSRSALSEGKTVMFRVAGLIEKHALELAVLGVRNNGTEISLAIRAIGAWKIAGVVHVNTYGGADGTVPLGGVRQSGNGHDKSLHALNKYTDLKTA